MTKLQQLHQAGQSVWIDYIRRDFIKSGELQRLVSDGLRGLTSNPSIFEKAIGETDDYKDQLASLAGKPWDVTTIYEALAMRDIRDAADTLYPVFKKSNGADGFVSLEANPKLAHDTQRTVDEVRRLFHEVARPNVMIKVPATNEGIPAIRTLIADGINVNVTLMFSRAQYDAVANAYIEGLQELERRGRDISRAASVASVFVSRVDTAADKKLEQLGDAGKPLLGKIAIANARLIYQHFKRAFGGERWQALAGQGGRVQRVLWGSTSTKNPAYSDIRYVAELIGPYTVNTMPLKTLNAFRDHGEVAVTVENDLDGARDQLKQLAELGIDLDQITGDLLDAGVKSFADDFEKLLKAIAKERQRLSSRNQPAAAAQGSKVSEPQA